MGDAWFKVYAADTILDDKLNDLSPEMERILWRLWCVQCREGLVCDDAAKLARKTGQDANCIAKFMQMHMQTFFVLHEGAWYSPRMLREKSGRGDVPEELSKVRSAAAKARWNRQKNNTVNAICIDNAMQKPCKVALQNAVQNLHHSSDSDSASTSVFPSKEEVLHETEIFDGQVWLQEICAVYPEDSNSGGSPAEGMAFMNACQFEMKRQGFTLNTDAAKYLLGRTKIHAESFGRYPPAERKYIPNLATFLDPEQRRYFRDPKERSGNGTSKAEQNEQQSRDAIERAALRFIERRTANSSTDVLGAEPVHPDDHRVRS